MSLKIGNFTATELQKEMSKAIKSDANWKDLIRTSPFQRLKKNVTTELSL